MRSRGAGIAGNPVLIGAATVLVVLVAVFLSYNANCGLPFVPTYQVEAEVPSAAQLVVGNDVKIGGSRVGAVTEIEPSAARRPRDRGARPDARQGRRAAAEGLDADGPAALRARPQVRRAHPRQVERDLRGRRHDRARAGQDAGRARRVPEHVRRGDARGVAGQPRGLRRPRSPAAASRSTPRSARSAAAARHRAGDARTCPRPRRTSSGSSSSSATRPRSSRPPPRSRRRCSAASTRRWPRCAMSGRRSRSRSPRASRRSTPGSRTPAPAPVPGQHRGPDARAAARPRALRTAAPVLADALVTGIARSAEDAAARPPLESLLRSCRRSPTTRWCRADPLDDGARHVARADARHLAPIQTGCNYVRLWIRNMSSPLSEGDRNGTWQRFIIVTTPRADNEGGRRRRRPTGRTSDNHVHINPYPTRRRSAAARVRGGQRALAARLHVSPTCRARSRPDRGHPEADD